MFAIVRFAQGRAWPGVLLTGSATGFSPISLGSGVVAGCREASAACAAEPPGRLHHRIDEKRNWSSALLFEQERPFLSNSAVLDFCLWLSFARKRVHPSNPVRENCTPASFETCLIICQALSGLQQITLKH